MTGRNIMAYLQLVNEAKGDVLKHQESLENEAELEALKLGYTYQQISDTKLRCCQTGGNYLAVLREAIRVRKEEENG